MHLPNDDPMDADQGPPGGAKYDPPNGWEDYLRRPAGTDAIGMRDIAEANPILDLNSVYAYLLFATDFSDTSIVAERGGELLGFITGYHPPSRPEVLFVWQVAVIPQAQGAGLAGAMLDGLTRRVRQDRRNHPVTVEATVTASNTASRALFSGFARRYGVPLTERPHFGADLLDADRRHDDEPIIRIGPITASLPRS